VVGPNVYPYTSTLLLLRISQNGICNCPSFFKEYIYKRIIGMAIMLKCCTSSPAAMDISLGEKRKRGRPRKATKALLIQ
jgi:hypothetical protein